MHPQRSRYRLITASLTIFFFFLFLHNFHGLGFENPGSWQPAWKPAATAVPGAPAPPEDAQLAFCVAVKDQSHDLREFFTHHYHHHGVRRFYIMDDGSKPPLSTAEYPIPESAITFRYFAPNFHQKWMQYDIYDACIWEFGDKHTWMAFIDTDEFIETKSGNSLHSILEELEADNKVGALGISRQTHSSAGLKERPTSVRKSFTKCVVNPSEPSSDGFKDNRLIKSIVKTAAYKKPLNPHEFFLQGENRTVGENLDVLDGANGERWPITRDKISLQHYALKSREEFEQKIHRGSDTTKTEQDGYWDHIEGLQQEDCLEMVQYDP